MTAPNRRDRTRPAELVGLAAGMALFIGLVVLMSTRQWDLTFVFTGVSFIVVLVVFAMLALATTTRGDDDTRRPPGDGH